MAEKTARTHGEVLAAARDIAVRFAASNRALSVLTSANIDNAKPYLLVAMAEMGTAARLRFGGFGQLESAILDSEDSLVDEETTAVFVHVRASDIDPLLAESADGLLTSDLRARLSAVIERIGGIIRATRSRMSGAIIVSNLVHEASIIGPFEGASSDGVGASFTWANAELASVVASVPGAHVFDYAGVFAAVGAERFRDARLWLMARAPMSVAALAKFAHELTRAWISVTEPAIKCIVVDLDNTLWGGVVGDDGVSGIRLGDDYPGNAFKVLQRQLLAFKHRGILLGIASKNEEAVAMEAIRSHPEMELRESDFAAVEIGWGAKAESISRIARKLNIGEDAIAFVDDNPVERAAVRAALPQVHVIEMPVGPYDYAEALRSAPRLSPPRILAEDRARSEMVATDTLRQQSAVAAPDMDTFLRGLQMTARVGRSDDTTFERVLQLINKTNQFNLTTRRYTAQKLREASANPNTDISYLRLRDRYGDLGLVGVGVVQKNGEEAVIDTLLMSCRVMGRGVEDALLAYVGERARFMGATRLRGEYVPTAKNRIVANFFVERGFHRDQDGFVVPLLDSVLRWPDRIAREEA